MLRSRVCRIRDGGCWFASVRNVTRNCWFGNKVLSKLHCNVTLSRCSLPSGGATITGDGDKLVCVGLDKVGMTITGFDGIGVFVGRTVGVRLGMGVAVGGRAVAAWVAVWGGLVG